MSDILMVIRHRLASDGASYGSPVVLESVTSAVWTERWQDYGEAQVSLGPGADVQAGDILTMAGRDMAVEVVAMTSTERGAELRCRDALSVLDRRIVYPTVANNGLVSTFVSKLLANDGIINTSNPWDRTLRPMRVGDLSAISGSANIQRSYDPVGEALLEVAKAYGFDPTCRLTDGHLVVGARTNSATRTWTSWQGLAGWTEDIDVSEARNVAYVGGQSNSSGRVVVPVLDEELAPANLDRREMFVDRRDIVLDGMDYDSAVDNYGQPSGQEGTASLTLETGEEGPMVILSQNMPHERATLQKYISMNAYMGSEKLGQAVEMHPWSAVTFMELGDVVTATISKGSQSVQFTFPASVLDDCLYRVQMYSYRSQVLWGPGEEALADLQPETAFEARTEGLSPYTDYGLGDTVTVVKADGSTRTMRVVEVVETWDSQGYRATPGLASL